MNKQGHDQLERVEETCADDGEILALSITRFIAAGYMTSDVACWDAAYNRAEAVLGSSAGPQFVASMAGLMRAIRAERQTDWRFMPAPCCRVTEDESQLFKLLALGRRRRWDDVRHHAALLAGADDAPRITSAVRLAAEALDSFRLIAAEPNSPQRVKAAALH